MIIMSTVAIIFRSIADICTQSLCAGIISGVGATTHVVVAKIVSVAAAISIVCDATVSEWGWTLIVSTIAIVRCFIRSVNALCVSAVGTVPTIYGCSGNWCVCSDRCGDREGSLFVQTRSYIICSGSSDVVIAKWIRRHITAVAVTASGVR